METNIAKIISLFPLRDTVTNIIRFHSDEDNAPYQVWKVYTQSDSFVLKKTTRREREVYEAFFSGGYTEAPRVYGFREQDEDLYMLMEYIPGQNLNRCTRDALTRALDAMISLQSRFWEDETHANVGFTYRACHANRQKRLGFMGDLSEAYRGYLEAFSTVPRTLCNDDMLPFNVIDTGSRAVIIDWEFAGILPYPCALARLLAYGEEDPNALFQMTREDQQYAVAYYYEHFIRGKGISWEEYQRTMKLFFLKEYSEWVYLANQSGDHSGEYYQKYSKYACTLASQLGLYSEV